MVCTVKITGIICEDGRALKRVIYERCKAYRLVPSKVTVNPRPYDEYTVYIEFEAELMAKKAVRNFDRSQFDHVIVKAEQIQQWIDSVMPPDEFKECSREIKGCIEDWMSMTTDERFNERTTCARLADDNMRNTSNMYGNSWRPDRWFVHNLSAHEIMGHSGDASMEWVSWC